MLALFALLVVCGVVAAQGPPTAGTADAAVVSEFEAKVKQYVEFRQQHVGAPSKPTDNPAEIVTREREMGNKIRKNK